ncbi:RBR-type E3 ubiquitin transferase [Quillaja saponaria]|uniref:RBR-type E3 ubiquitin transferase n=1 Tax=Quillaja saponaria TaxID=32244 RepID=A0AAD7QFQ5_QUISA|nr:RBR-type E3 ubiquitin transferase [Quillaja saponaria]
MEKQDVAKLLFTCELCTETRPRRMLFHNNQCVHDPFCSTCIARHIEAKVEESEADIKCPNLNCDQSLDPISCRPIVPKSVFDKWSDLLCASFVLDFERRCYCPDMDCSALVIDECSGNDEGGAVRKVNCPNCKKPFCFQCKVPWHEGVVCSLWSRERLQIRDLNDILFRKLFKEKGWSRCYRCGQAVERVAGCREISCRCGAKLCYYCGGKTSHTNPCKCKMMIKDLGVTVILSALAFVATAVVGSRVVTFLTKNKN